MKKEKGFLIVTVLVFSSIAIAAILSLLGFANVNIIAGRRAIVGEQAFQLAEAGAEYYRWHLAHAPSDFTDGGGEFPHIHNFFDKDGDLIGSYELTVIPPPAGSTLVTIRSTGIPSSDPSIRRTIVTTLGIPSFARFALVSDSNLRFGVGTDVVGPIHSNSGIRFDGLAHNLVTSALSTYNDPDHDEPGADPHEFAVHTHLNLPPDIGINNNFRASEAPPTTPVPSRTDVFLAGRRFPVPTTDFNAITTDLVGLKDLAQNGGQYFASSTSQGYRVVFNPDDTYTVYRVTSLQSAPNDCDAPNGQLGWGTWSINNSSLLDTYNNPSNGIIYMEDHVWVEGQIDTARITLVAAATSSPTARSITVNNDLLYTNYDGQDALALIAENNINVGLSSANNLRIDAALIANEGRIGRYSYSSSCGSSYIRNHITLYGMLGSYLRYGFTYANQQNVITSGYQTRNLIYDAGLLYSPPPSFPLISDTYQIVSWQEVK